MSRFQEHAVQVRAPATSANLGPGFDSLGLALELYDEVEIRVAGAGLDLRVQGESAPAGADNLVVRAARAAFQRMGVGQPGLSLTCTNRIPHGRGMGSSAAAIVAGVSAARALTVNASMSDADVFGLAAELEGHPDNVAACMAGGLTVAWGDDDGLNRWVRLEPDASLRPLAVIPEEKLSTEQARGLLPAHVTHRDAAVNAGRAALLVAALTGRTDLLVEATEDRLHQPYRAGAMPRTAELLEKLRAAGLPAVISGAGPTVLVLATAETAGSIDKEMGADWHVHQLRVDRAGARVQEMTP